jgi:hypothetical protein
MFQQRNAGSAPCSRAYYTTEGELISRDSPSFYFFECHYAPCTAIETEPREFAMCGRCQVHILQNSLQTIKTSNWIGTTYCKLNSIYILYILIHREPVTVLGCARRMIGQFIGTIVRKLVEVHRQAELRDLEGKRRLKGMLIDDEGIF